MRTLAAIFCAMAVVMLVGCSCGAAPAPCYKGEVTR